MNPAPAQAILSRLRADRSLRLDEGACLPLRSVHGQCRACADACPAGALTVSVAAVELSDACTGCGRCAAACPTQALSLPEMVALDAVPAAAEIRVECRKVPAKARRGETVEVPCLGAITTGHLLARAAAGADVTMVDRGWCDGCASGAGSGEAANPARAAVQAAVVWLQAVGSPRQVSIASEPLPVAQRPEAIPPLPDEGLAIDRRRFFRAAIDKPAGRDRAVPMGGNGRAAYPADQRRPSPERERQHLALQQLAQAAKAEVPAEFYPVLHADRRCCGRRMCVALCPTAALAVAESGTESQLQWSSERCIACGTCVRACPESALVLAPHGGTAGMQVLAVHRQARCAACGERFTLPADTEPERAPTLCPTCTKSRRFIDDARRQLFGARH